jgi:hypothetical protein
MTLSDLKTTDRLSPRERAFRKAVLEEQEATRESHLKFVNDHRGIL